VWVKYPWKQQIVVTTAEKTSDLINPPEISFIRTLDWILAK
jgi:hypothetical protein